MSAKPLSDEDAQATVDAYRAAGNNAAAAARAVGMPRDTFNSRLKVAAARGMLLDHKPAMPGFRIAQVTDGPAGRSVQQLPERGDKFELPRGHRVKGVSALTDPDGNEIIKWIKTTEGAGPTIEAVAAYLKSAFADVPPVMATPAPADAARDLLTLIPCNDWHLGMFAWGKETAENWDLKIAERVIGAAIKDVISRSKPSGQAVILGGGDLIHADNKENKTARSGNALDVDGRYQKIVGAAGRLMVRTVDAALLVHQHVTVRILPGNHDEHAAVAIAYYLAAWYRDHPRVTVDVSPSLYFKHVFGLVMLAGTHGHTVKLERLPGIMAARWPAEWGATRHRYAHGFHLHHKAGLTEEDSGVELEIHQAPIPPDSWHYGAGYCSGRSVQAITYHRELGERGRVREIIMDGALQENDQ